MSNKQDETGGCIVVALIIIGLFIASSYGCNGCKKESAPPPKKETISQGEAVALGISAFLIGIAAGADSSSSSSSSVDFYSSNYSPNSRITTLSSEFGSKEALEETLRFVKSQRIQREQPNAIHHYDSDGYIRGYSK